METGDRDLRERILAYLKESDGHTVREVAHFSRVSTLQALKWLHELQREGLANYTSEDDLWRAACSKSTLS